MSTTYKPPEISVAYDMDTDLYQLMATSHSRTATAGPRIFRAEPWPSIQFSHADEDAANRDAATLRSYLDDCATGRRKDRNEPAKRGWWQD